jgi:hypothetical protein
MLNRKILALIGIILSLNGITQDTIPRKASVILVHGVAFKEVVNHLLDKNYLIDKIDSNYNTLQTQPANYDRTLNKIVFNLRVKDSVLYVTALCGMPKDNTFAPGSLGAQLQGIDLPVRNLGIWKGNKKSPWVAMNNFALSFNKPVEYLVQ